MKAKLRKIRKAVESGRMHELLKGDAPVAQRISHRIMLYAAQRSPLPMNQFMIEDIIREETAKGND